jgi:hypothetical protein
MRTRANFVGAAAAIAIVALFYAAPLGEGEATVASGSVRLVDQTTDLPAPTPSPGLPLPPGRRCRRGRRCCRAGCRCRRCHRGRCCRRGRVVLPGGPDLPPLPSPVDLSQLAAPDVQQLWARMLQLAASPPPNVPNEVCRYNTVRVPC